MKNKEIYFKPWVGRNYKSGGIFKKKVLIVGESHYQNEKGKVTKHSTKEIVNDIRSGYYEKIFFTNIFNLFCDQSIPVNRFWDSIAFYNFVQVVLKGGAAQRPTPKMFADSHDAFSEVLDKHRPDIVIILGKTTWNNLQEDLKSWLGNKGENIRIGKHTHETWTFEKKNGPRIFLTYVYHPSYRYFSANADKWKKLIKLVLENNKNLIK